MRKIPNFKHQIPNKLQNQNYKKQKINVHIKVETGTSRQGVLEKDILDFVKFIKKLENINIEGISTHYANIEDTTDHSYAKLQLGKFKKIVELLKNKGFNIPIKHTACSAATVLFPKAVDAYVAGSTPTSNVVGLKDDSNTRINPATEETVSTLLKTSDLTFDTGSLQVKVTSLPSSGSASFSDSGSVDKKGLVDADRHVQVDVLSSALPSSASTETTLQTISFGGFKFALRLATVGDVDYVGEAAIGTATSAASWRIKRVDSTTGVIIQWAGTGVFDQVWNNRASLSYS